METQVQENISISAISGLFAKQQAMRQALKNTSAEERIFKLKSIKNWIENNQQKVINAIEADFKKHATETLVSELLIVLSEIKHLIKITPKLMAPQRVASTATMLTTSAWIQHEPKGCALIISPWNYPFNLAVKPVVQAIAAGCTVVLKPSEMTPHTSALLKNMFEELFENEEVKVLEGAVELSQTLLAKPFDHIFFTGSPAVGKIVMQAAAKHLASVTLELGGKSPVIIDETVHINKMAQSIAWGKCFNAGQTCIAPDYVLVQKSVKAEFIEALKFHINKMYGAVNEQLVSNKDFARIVNARHFNRLQALLQDAQNNNAEVLIGGYSQAEENFISPTILDNCHNGMKVMQEEIFGPILPIIAFDQLQEAIDFVNNKEKPLALYIGSNNSKNTKYILQNTSSGAAVINDCMLHYGHNNLPFGGVNNSGIGKSGGKYGFLEFSNQKAVLKQHFSMNNMLYPPYSKKIDGLVRTIIKYFS